MKRRAAGLAALAAAAGAGRLLRTVPGVAGAVLVTVGFALAWLPLGFIVAGGFCLLLDARIPAAAETVRYPDGRVRPAPERRLGVVA